MEVLARRLQDQGEDWRHVYKSLLLLEYMAKHGPQKVQLLSDVMTAEAYRASALLMAMTLQATLLGTLPGILQSQGILLKRVASGTAECPHSCASSKASDIGWDMLGTSFVAVR